MEKEMLVVAKFKEGEGKFEKFMGFMQSPEGLAERSKVAVVEKAELGGICLNWGCIPTKALLKSAQVFEYINHAEDYGISVDNAKHDFTKVIKRSIRSNGVGLDPLPFS